MQHKLSKFSLGGAIDEVKVEGDEEGESLNENQFEKLCSNDKVIQSIKQLIDQNKDDTSRKKKEHTEVVKDHKAITSECE